jgi:hypothetical protein
MKESPGSHVGGFCLLYCLFAADVVPKWRHKLGLAGVVREQGRTAAYFCEDFLVSYSGLDDFYDQRELALRQAGAV